MLATGAPGLEVTKDTFCSIGLVSSLSFLYMGTMAMNRKLQTYEPIQGGHHLRSDPSGRCRVQRRVLSAAKPIRRAF